MPWFINYQLFITDKLVYSYSSAEFLIFYSMVFHSRSLVLIFILKRSFRGVQTHDDGRMGLAAFQKLGCWSLNDGGIILLNYIDKPTEVLCYI